MLQIVGSNTKNNSGFYSNLNIADVHSLSLDQSNSYTHFNRHFSQSNLQKNLINDAITLLNADHDYLIYLFFTYENSTNTIEKTLLLTQICTELLLHRQVEEEVFYPVAKLALLNDGYLIDEPIIEHNGLIALIADIQQFNNVENLESDRNIKDDSFKNKVDILAEYVKHHVKQEREYIFPKLRAASIDLKALKQAIELRKIVLREQTGESFIVKKTRFESKKFGINLLGTHSKNYS